MRANILDEYFSNKLKSLDCREDTKSYLISTLSKYINSKYDLSNESLTLFYIKANESYSFEKYQNLSDWILMTRIMYPSHLKNASIDYYRTLARYGYLSCYKILNKSWPLFEELSDNFIYIEESSRKLINK